MRTRDWAMLAVIAALFGGMAWFLFRPLPRLPVDTVNGNYSNACCQPITLSDGNILLGGKQAGHYVIEWGKKGPYILPDVRITVSEGRRIKIARGGSPVTWRFGNGGIELTNGEDARYIFTQAPAR